MGAYRLCLYRWLLACWVCLFCVSSAQAGGTQVLFSPTLTDFGPFPSNLFTVADPSQNTGIRVNLPHPGCLLFPSECDDLDVINTLDGFNLQPRVLVRFSGPIDLSTVTSDTVFLLHLGSSLATGNPGGSIVGINQVVWDPETNTLYAESDELLEQHSRYALIVTNGVQDLNGKSVREYRQFRRFRKGLNFGHPDDFHLETYRQSLREARRAARDVGVRGSVVMSVFTTQSTTATLEKIRDQIKAAPSQSADFLIGSNGTRTVFPLPNIANIIFNRQVGALPVDPLSFQASEVPVLGALAIPGAVGSIAFGKYRSPNYLNDEQIIPPMGSLTGTPVEQNMQDVFFSLFLPATAKPAHGWPIAIFGHGFTDHKDNGLYGTVASMAANGIAVIAINVVGHGGGALGTHAVNLQSGETVIVPSGGRGFDQDENGVIDSTEGVNAALTQAIVANRDGLQQTVADLIQLVQVIESGVDIESDGTPDLDSSRIYYFGQSFGGIYGTLFLAIEPNVQVGVPNVPGGSNPEVARLGVFRPLVELALVFRSPPLNNVGDISMGDFRFTENIPLRNQPPLTNTVPGAIPIQEVIERSEWVSQAANPVAYAPYLVKDPLPGVPAKSVLYQFARGDQTVPNPTTSAIIRAGDLADVTTLYRNDLAFADPLRNPTGQEVSKNPHTFLLNLISPGTIDVAFGAQQQIATFFTSDGTIVLDPDGPAGPLFEVPIGLPLPEDLGFIP